MMTKDDWFRVEVSDRDGEIVTIESEMLAGRDIGGHEKETILRAIDHLSAFVGLSALSQKEWVMVPREPTMDMMLRGSDFMGVDSTAKAARIYRAMLQASPAHGEGERK